MRRKNKVTVNGKIWIRDYLNAGGCLQEAWFYLLGDGTFEVSLEIPTKAGVK